MVRIPSTQGILVKMIYFVSNGEKCKMYNIDQYEGGLKLADIVTNNDSDNDLNNRIKYIMVRLEK